MPMLWLLSRSIVEVSKTYSELMRLDNYLDRFAYLQLNGSVAGETFGGHRYLNQVLYRSPEWKRFRRDMIIRDSGCDLAHSDYPIVGKIMLHHINPITEKDILDRSPNVFDPENVVCVSDITHNAIHYGDENLLPHDPVERRPNDTSPWRK